MCILCYFPLGQTEALIPVSTELPILIQSYVYDFLHSMFNAGRPVAVVRASGVRGWTGTAL